MQQRRRWLKPTRNTSPTWQSSSRSRRRERESEEYTYNLSYTYTQERLIYRHTNLYFKMNADGVKCIHRLIDQASLHNHGEKIDHDLEEKYIM